MTAKVPQLRANRVMEGLCAARTRRGTCCKRKGSGRGGRCKLHGGMSTGPSTWAGRQAISQGQAARWARWRAENPRLFGGEIGARQERRIRTAFNQATRRKSGGLTGTNQISPPLPRPRNPHKTQEQKIEERIERQPRWRLHRLIRQQQQEAEQARGRELMERHGRGVERQRFANVGHLSKKRRRRR